MMTCPQCKNRVPTKAVWQATGLSGVVCPHCNASLWPIHWRSAILLMLSILSGIWTESLLRRQGFGFAVGMLGLIVTMIAVYLLLAGTILRLRVKDEGPTLLPHGKL